MRLCVWKTGHEIADTVAGAVYEGLSRNSDVVVCEQQAHDWVSGQFREFDAHIAYGILRGCGDVFRECDRIAKPWLNIDRGYWKPNHYDGYYRISFRGTQQTAGLDKLQPNYDRWDALGVDVLPTRKRNGPVLICPPTIHARQFFRLSEFPDMYEKEWFGRPKGQRYIMRTKECERPLQEDFDNCSKVCTFNSSVGWEALRQGIPVISDPTHSIVGAYQKMVDRTIHDDLNERRRLFSLMASLQLTLEEMKSGKLYPLILKLLEANA